MNGTSAIVAMDFKTLGNSVVGYVGGTHGLIARYNGIVTDLRGREGDSPLSFQLMQNYPNPFNPSTTIRYALPSKAHVTITVFNTLGQVVATLVNDTQNAGYHDAHFDGSGLASGVYFYRLQAGDFVQTKRLLILR
jgi:hypothetical protein